VWAQVVDSPQPFSPNDVQVSLWVMISSWNDVFSGVLGSGDRNFVFEAREVRNRWVH
jgi:hypothetical protein